MDSDFSSFLNPSFDKGIEFDPNTSYEKGIGQNPKPQKKDRKRGPTLSVRFDCQLTINKVENGRGVIKYLEGLKNCQYLIACKEIAPETGHEHIHIYVQFNKKTILAVSKLGGAHYEICKGTPDDNIKYIIKEGNIIEEWGTPIKNHNKKKLSIKDIEKMPKEERGELSAYYYNIIEKINTKEGASLTLEDFSKKVQIYYLWGESGAGKTLTAKKLIGVSNEYKEKGCFNEVKYTNSFWIGVNEQSTLALYDDFRDTHMPPSEFINFIDYNVHTMNIKGGCQKNKYTFIIITSVQDPHMLYEGYSIKHPEAKEQWLRRMKKINISPEYFKSITEGIKLIKLFIFNILFKLLKN